ncbi:AraC family transcriptional regulator [Rhizobium sp. XQZ8]|uniref:AraC family transcriptional regulator n=1 Tax=Rhizobium populisoli TaxID=2859785 RepID=UPI001C666AF7|nr:helix-turn-helix transcriptional regulator [Rhizobium populisoli]MBW6425274.1 AraC family transcriptional regulator [Rhizobium populisoli]
MLQFSTDDLREADRFDEWREARGKHLFGVTIELDPERRKRFHGSFKAFAVGGAIASEMQASSYRVSRTAADIARLAGNSLCISLQVRGPGILDTGRDLTQSMREGDFAISHSDLPFRGTPYHYNDFSYRLLKIPLNEELVLGRPAHDLFATTLSESPLFRRAFQALFDALTMRSQTLANPDVDVLHIARLSMAARGRLPLTMPEIKTAIRVGLNYAAREIMARRHHEASLNPANVAAELGVSIRYLHMLFKNSEMSFSRTLTAMRAEGAYRRLMANPTLAVTQAAYASGFDSIATFYRAFANAYGMAPGDLRTMRLAS